MFLQVYLRMKEESQCLAFAFKFYMAQAEMWTANIN